MASGSGSSGSSAHRTPRSASRWPQTADDLIAEQIRLASEDPAPWSPPAGPLLVGACWACFPRGLTGVGAAGDPSWAAAVVMKGRRVLARAVIEGVAAAAYEPGLLALREGPLLESAVRRLATLPDVLLVNATGRDHPRRAGLALHLGAVLDLPTVGVTHRPLTAEPAPLPPGERGASSPVRVDDEVVACWLRTRPGRRPVLVHPGWRVGLPAAIEVVRRSGGSHRTPAPLREARRLARRARASRVFGRETPRS